MSPLGWALIQSDWYPYKKRKFGHTERHQRSPQKKDHVRTQREDGHLQVKEKKKPNLLTPWPWTSSLQNCRNIHFCCLYHPDCEILLQQPKQTNTAWPMVSQQRVVLCRRAFGNGGEHFWLLQWPGSTTGL